MKKDYMIILINARKDEAVTVQKILTEWGCFIKTRLGLHNGTLEDCTENGTVFLELAGTKEKHEELCRKLNLLKGVSAKIIEMEA
ncbi:MAG: hypothetical protein B6226_01580 [Candidatus Cloacimonetes bacterium 4572_65]|nr:MAG: hypothetical protein B6226_01580 [Candidatus Cloacimonetes bacterium 4572_65]